MCEFLEKNKQTLWYSEGTDIFLAWLYCQTMVLPVLQRALISKEYFYPLFVMPYQIFVQNVNEFLDVGPVCKIFCFLSGRKESSAAPQETTLDSSVRVTKSGSNQA